MVDLEFDEGGDEPFDNTGCTIEFDNGLVLDFDTWEAAGSPEEYELPELVGSIDLQARMGLE